VQLVGIQIYKIIIVFISNVRILERRWKVKILVASIAHYFGYPSLCHL
jgi:hypothetical protein